MSIKIITLYQIFTCLFCREIDYKVNRVWNENGTVTFQRKKVWFFEQSDLVSLHCPQTPEMTGFVNAERLSTMKTGALFVNTARGGLVDEAALASALRNGELGGAALDVLTVEPMAKDCPLIGAPNCLITPHIAWASEPARRRLLQASVDNLIAFQNNSPVNVVSV